MKKLLFLPVLMLLLSVAAQGALPTPILELKADSLTPGVLATWNNTGSASGSFAKNTPTGTEMMVETVAGRQAVTFDGFNGLKSSFQTPAALTGKTPWTVAVWIYNPYIASEENFLQWARIASPNGSGASFGYGSSGSLGAAIHQGGDYGFDRLIPAPAQWHLFTYTYEGTTTKRERLWVDGIFTTQRIKTTANELNITTASTEFVYVGMNSTRAKFSGSIASLQVWNSVLTPEQIYELQTAGGGTPPSPLSMVTNFEYPRAGDALNINGGLVAPQKTLGWYDSPNFGVGSRSTFNTAWDNGQPPDATQVAALWDGGSMGAYVPGFKAGKSYKLVYTINAKSGVNVPSLNVKLAGASLPGYPKTITAVEGANSFTQPFTRVEENLTSPGDTGAWLEFSEPTVLTPAAPTGQTGYTVLISSVAVYETGGAANPVLSTNALDFLGVQNAGTGDMTLTVTNQGGTALTVNAPTFSGADAARFSIVGGTFPATVAAYGGKLNITVRLTSNGIKSYAGTLTLPTSVGSPTVALSGFTPAYPTVANNSFELPVHNIQTPYGDNLAIPGWSPSPAWRIGVGNRTNPYVNNGTLYDGKQVLWMQTSPSTPLPSTPRYQKISQMVAGFHAGQACKVVLWVSARGYGDNKASLKVTLGGTQLTSESITYVAGTNPFLRKEYDFTPAASSAYLLELGNELGYDDSAVLIDRVSIYEVGGAPIIVVPPSLTLASTVNIRTTGTLTVFNEGGSTMTISGLSVLGDSQFAAASTPPIIVPPFGGSNTLAVSFKPNNTAGASGGSLKIDSNATQPSVSVPLFGAGYDSVYQTNFSFEQPVFAGQTTLGDSLLIPGWSGTPVAGIGVAITSNPHFNNGLPPAGNQVLWIQGAKSTSQLVPGFVPGGTYHISMNVNARKQGDGLAHMIAKIGGTTLFSGIPAIAGITNVGGKLDITALEAANAHTLQFYKLEQDFVANAPAMLLEIAQPGTKTDGTAIDDSTLLVDNLSITGGPAVNPVKSWTFFK